MARETEEVGPADRGAPEDPATAAIEEEAAGPAWAMELVRLCGHVSSHADDPGRDEIRDRLWLILNLALRRYMRIHGSRLASLRPEDLEDLGSQKALELLDRIVSHSHELRDRTAGQIASFLSVSARNAVLDLAKRAGRLVRPKDHEWEREMHGPTKNVAVPDDTHDRAEAEEYAQDLLGCLGKLPPRSRLIWFFRVFYEMSSREIAGHPRIQLEFAHVDVLMQRTREGIRKCLQGSGHAPSHIPPGVYALVWNASRSWDRAEDSARAIQSSMPTNDTSTRVGDR